MPNQFYIDPNKGRDPNAVSSFSDQLTGLGQILQQKRDETEVKQKEAQRQEETQDALDSGDPKQISAITAKYPETAAATERAFGITNNHTRKLTQELAAQVVNANSPDQAADIIDQYLPLMSDAGGEPLHLTNALIGLRNGTQSLEQVKSIAMMLSPELLKTSRAGGMASAKTEIYPDGTVVQSLPNNTSQVLDPAGNIVTGEARKKTLKDALKSRYEMAGGKAAAAAQGKADVELGTAGPIAASIIESERPGRVQTEQEIGTAKSNVSRLKVLKDSNIGRAAALTKATGFLKEFEKGAKSGAGRHAASFVPGVYTSQGQFDEKFNAFAEVAARQKLKASGETRPTDSDVQGMKQAMFGVGRAEEVNIALLKEFINELNAENAELQSLLGQLSGNQSEAAEAVPAPAEQTQRKITVDF